MYYKLSNTAERERIEKAFRVSFKYPNLYRPEVVINGLTESILPVITSTEPEAVSPAIWGLLPEHFRDDWQHFQNLTNTLNIDERNALPEFWYTEALKKRRCLILVTGFFTTYIKNGTTYPYYVSLKSGDPFFLAGIYNILEDGFISCALLIGKANTYIQRFQNVVDSMPIVVPKSSSGFWLNEDMSFEDIKTFLAKPRKSRLRANPIAKEFFNQNISYDSMLEPYDYEDLPIDE